MRSELIRFISAGIAIAAAVVLSSGHGHAGSSDTGIVSHVIDGDTIILRDKRRVRYIGINTPEVAHKGKKGEPFGEAARALNRKLVQGRTVRLEFDRQRQDQYGRTLAYVYLANGTFVNARMLREGLAHCLYDRTNHRHANRLLKIQREAMTAGKGIWSRGKHRKEKRVGSRKSRRFHRPECQFARRISEKNRKVFDTQWEAYWEGYAPAKKCDAGR